MFLWGRQGLNFFSSSLACVACLQFVHLPLLHKVFLLYASPKSSCYPVFAQPSPARELRICKNIQRGLPVMRSTIRPCSRPPEEEVISSVCTCSCSTVHPATQHKYNIPKIQTEHTLVAMHYDELCTRENGGIEPMREQMLEISQRQFAVHRSIDSPEAVLRTQDSNLSAKS